ncbi:MAG: hypothetical protein J6C31_06530 [Prevotella sp.]|nr:hypothetical protein [Prevotella sp.]
MKDFFDALMTIVYAVAIIGLLIWAVMLLWNAILPDLTGWHEINFWQSAGLCLMFRLMTGHIGISYYTKDSKKRKRRHLHDRISKKYKLGDGTTGIEMQIQQEK